MSIATEISRIKGLRNDLTDILVDKNIISSGTHTLEEDVVAVENFTPSTYNLQSKTVSLGQNELTVTPDTGYNGLSSVSFTKNSTYVRANYIKSGHKIMNTTGTAGIINNLRKLTWQVQISQVSQSASSITLYSSNATAFPNGSFTPGNRLPVDLSEGSSDPFVLYMRRSSSYVFEWDDLRKEVLLVICYNMFNTNNRKTYYNDRYGNYLETGISISPNSDNTAFTISPTSAAGCVIFGRYDVEIIY